MHSARQEAYQPKQKLHTRQALDRHIDVFFLHARRSLAVSLVNIMHRRREWHGRRMPGHDLQ